MARSSENYEPPAEPHEPPSCRSLRTSTTEVHGDVSAKSRWVLWRNTKERGEPPFTNSFAKALFASGRVAPILPSEQMFSTSFSYFSLCRVGGKWIRTVGGEVLTSHAFYFRASVTHFSCSIEHRKLSSSCAFSFGGGVKPLKAHQVIFKAFCAKCREGTCPRSFLGFSRSEVVAGLLACLWWWGFCIVRFCTGSYMQNTKKSILQYELPKDFL